MGGAQAGQEKGRFWEVLASLPMSQVGSGEGFNQSLISNDENRTSERWKHFHINVRKKIATQSSSNVISLVSFLRVCVCVCV